MANKYLALKTKTFTFGKTQADIIESKRYDVDIKNKCFINEQGEIVYVTEEEINEYFKEIKVSAQQKFCNKYFVKNVKTIILRLFPSDQDIIDFLEKNNIKSYEKAPRKNGICEYVRQLIREDMKRQKGE